MTETLTIIIGLASAAGKTDQVLSGYLPHCLLVRRQDRGDVCSDEGTLPQPSPPPPPTTAATAAAVPIMPLLGRNICVYSSW